MATYRFGNGRDVNKKYAFKFNIIGELTSDFWNPLLSPPKTVWNGFVLKTGANPSFIGQVGDTMMVSVFEITGPVDSSRFRINFDPAKSSLYNPDTGIYSVQLFCDIGATRFKFDLELADGIDLNDPDVELRNSKLNDNQIKGDAFYYRKIINGTVEGYFYENLARNEYISIDEHYPVSELLKFDAGCGNVTIYQNDKPNKETVRHFPKYTTLNWYEGPDPKKKSSIGVFINYTNKKGEKKFRKSISNFGTVAEISDIVSKTMIAWGLSNSGYISIGANVPQADITIKPLSFKGYYVDDSKFQIPSAINGIGYPGIAIYMEADAVRQASFQAAVNDWKTPHTNEVTAYIVGFGSTGKQISLQTSATTSADFPEPTFEEVKTKSGLITAKNQTYTYWNGSIHVYDGDVNPYSDIGTKAYATASNSGRFDNRQKWIMGFINGDTFGEKLDDLESPPRLYEYQEWYDRFCYDRNTVPRELTIDEDKLSELTGASKLVPIPIKGWKFNALSLQQSKTFPIVSQTEGETGNIRYFVGTDDNPNYYGDLNLSGYRYLHLEIASKSTEISSGNLEITEVAKGFNNPTNSNPNFLTASTNIKSWKVSTSSKDKKIVRIDLCNPDNFSLEVDEQDSPYPRLNLYSNAVTTEGSTFGFFKKDNPPKENFILAKPSLASEKTDWIDDNLKQKLKDHNFVYFRDPDKNVYDYFEVNTTRFPKAGVGTDTLYGLPRVKNGYIKLSRPWDGDIAEKSGDINDGPIGQPADYKRTLWLKITKNDLTKNKTIEDIVKKDTKNNTYPDEFEIYDYYFGYPDITDVLAKLSSAFEENEYTSRALFTNNIPGLFDGEVPYTYIVLEDSSTKTKGKYKFTSFYYNGETKEVVFFLENVPNTGKKFSTSTTVKLAFPDGETDDRFTSIFVKFKNDVISSDPKKSFKNFQKFGNEYRAIIEYSKRTINGQIIKDSLPFGPFGSKEYYVLGEGVPILPLATELSPRPVDITYKKDTKIELRLLDRGADSCANAIFANDDFPEDEILNGPTYGVTRATKIELKGLGLELGKMFLTRDTSEADFVIGGNDHYFERQTKFQVSSTRKTTYYTRRFWQQNTDGRNEEEGDINWQMTPITTQYGDEESWTLYPKSISQLCDDINATDKFLTPCYLNNGVTFAGINTRHPGWIAQKFETSYPTDPITGERIYGNYIDPDYLNTDSGYASWIFGGGIVALPSGKNTGSGTTYQVGIDISFNEVKNIIAQTVFHRINADFPPGKADPFGNTSLKNKTDSTQISTDPNFDPTIQKSIVHLRGGLVCRGPAHGLILDVDKKETQTASYYEVAKPDNILAGQGTLPPKTTTGYYSTENPYAKNGKPHFVTVEVTKRFPNPAKSSTQDHTQSKRRRVSFKGVKQNNATNLSACESGFEKSIVIAYTIPGTGSTNRENQTAIITTDSFFTQQYERYPVGYNRITGTGVTVKGEFPFVLASETHINQIYKVNTFLLTERNSNSKAKSSHDYECLIAANTDMRNKLSWYPFIDGHAKTDANFSTLAKAFKGTQYNSYAVTDQAPQLLNVGYADPGAIVFRSISLNTTSVNAPVTDKTLFIDGVPPVYISDFRLINPISFSGTAYSSFPTVAQLSSREYIVAYSLNASPRQINSKIISNYVVQEKNILFDLDALAGNTLSEKYNIYGLTSDYDERLRLFRSVFWCNGGIYYFEHPISSSSLGKKRSDKLHLIKGRLDDNLVTELSNRKNIVTYYKADSELNVEVPKHKPAIISCKKQEYDGKVMIAYDTGKCYIEAVLFHPFTNIIGTRKFDIECVNNLGSTTNQDNPPVADIQANPTSGQSSLFVNFLSTNSFDPGGSTLTYVWNFGDDTQSTEENPSHTFVNNTTNPIEFKVTLIVTNSNGVSSSPATVTITVNPAPVNNLSPQAKFSATPTSGDVTLTVTFTDQSTPANDGSFIQIYEWDFGDGNTAIKFDNTPFTYDYTRAGSFTPKLFVKDNLARLSSTFIGPTINVNGKVNNPPAPNFTWTQTSFAPTLVVKFTDTSSDVEGPLVAWHWDFGDTQTADVQNPEHIYAAPGKYRVVLTVTDSGGLQVSGTIEITVLPPGNNPPIANFNYSQQNRKLVVDFTDTSTDTDGTITSWSWDFGDTFVDRVQNPSHTYLSAGTYQVTLTVTDNGGKSSFITKNVVVNPLVNQAPSISSISGNQTSFKPLIVKFTETSSDPDGFITQWDWNFGDGHTFTTNNSALKNPTNTYLFPGVYTVTLTVTDDGLPDGTNKKTATSSIQFTVAPPPANQPPVALFTVDANNVMAPATILFTDASTDADGKIVSWLWEFEAGFTQFFNAQTYQKNISHTFTKSGTFPVKLTVTDDGNLTNTYVLDIIIKNNAPVAILTAFPNPALSQTQVSFFGNTSYDIDGTISKYAWDFGDTTIISQGRTTENHTYAKPGTYKVSLTVTDNLGDSSTANLFIDITNRSPVARITYTTLTVKAPRSLTFNGDTSTDIDGTIASYSWSVSGSVVATTPNATINFTTQGTYIVSLTVTDDFGATNTASVTVNVTPPDNILPIAILKVNKNSSVINDTFTFDVSSSYDPDGSIVLYQLDFGDNTSTQFVNPTSISHIYSAVGSYTAKLTITDNRSGVSLETINSVQIITINNQPPVASFSYSPIGAFTFDPIKFTDNSSDPENALSKWVWDFGDLTTFTTTDSLQKNPTKSYNKGNKDYTVALTVYDNFGLSSTTSQIVHINNRKPFAVISTNYTPTNNVIVGIAPFTVIFDSNSYDLDGTIANYEWYVTGLVGTPFTTKSFTYTFDTARFTPYVITLRVQDDDGTWSDLANIGVKVNPPNVPPVAVIKANPASNSSFAPATVAFSAAGSYDPDNVGGQLIYAWDFGNNGFSDQIDAATTYTSSGTYKVSLTVTDNLGATNTAKLDYIVKNNKPVAVLDTVPTGITQVQVNTSVSFTSQGSYDTDTNQFINGYKWLVDGINQNSNTNTFTTSFGTVGNHVVTLSVFDNLGLESNPISKTIVVTPVPPANQNPIAILGNEPSVTGYIELKVGDSFTFDGTTSYDPEDGSNITFEWSIDGVKSGYTSTFVNQFNTVGIFTISLVVFDTQKLSSTPATNLGKRYSVQVNVSAAPNPLANKLFSSGYGYYGAIASGDKLDRYSFQLVDDTKQYTLISAGGDHTLVVDADGKLYASGSNAEGQLGFPSNITQLNSLTLVPLASKYKVVRICAGDFESAIIAEDTSINKRVLLVCGNNSNGIFGQSLPRTNIFNFQPIIERNITSNGVSYASNNSLLDVSCNSGILAFIDNRQVWVSGAHNYPNKIGIVDNGFIPINIDPNPDNQIGSTNYLNPIKLSVGYEGSGLRGAYVTGIGYDIYNQIVWFTGLTSLRGWGYAYDIAATGAIINIISASQDQFDRSIIFYELYASETPNFLGATQSASLIYPGEFYIKIESGTACLLALTQNSLFAYGVNQNGCMGLPQSFNSSVQTNLQYNLPKYTMADINSVIGPYEISTGGAHSLVLASDVKPSGNNFTIIRPDGYPSIFNLTIYPINQIAQ